jgi:hypothetical protein
VQPLGGALAGQDGRMLGRSLLAVANVITALAPVAADWNDSHIINMPCSWAWGRAMRS